MTKHSNEASARPKRVPLHNRQVLSVEHQDPNYVYRIVNTNLEKDPERVQRFIEAGYEIVPKKDAGQIGDNRVDNPSAPGSASLISVGQGTKAVLMRIRKEFYVEDQADKQSKIDELEGTMKRPTNVDYGAVEQRPANSKI